MPSSWIALNVCGDDVCSAVTGPATAPTDIALQERLTVPQNAATGTYRFHVTVGADGVDRAAQDVTIVVTDNAVNGLTLTAKETSVPVGLQNVPLGSIPISRLASLSPDPASAGPAGSTGAAGSIGSAEIVVVADGLKYVIVKGTVVTVLDQKMDPKRSKARKP